jgi:hypothetical protein
VKKVIIAVLLVVVFVLAFSSPAFAADPPANDWGQTISDNTPRGVHAKVGQGGLQGGRPWSEAHESIKSYHMP